MEELFIYNVLVRWSHVLVGIVWIGLLYYFNFVQTEYVKVADPDAKADVMKKLAPNALWWFRWAAFFTFLTGLILLYSLERLVTTEIILGSIMGTIMMLNVWGIIWRNQKVVIGLKEGDAAAADGGDPRRFPEDGAGGGSAGAGGSDDAAPGAPCPAGARQPRLQ